MKKIKIIFVLIFSLILLASCVNTSKENVEFNITIAEMENGSVSTNVVQAQADELVNITVTPNIGYVLEEVKANDDVITNDSFVMPKEDVIITATFKADGVLANFPKTNLRVTALNGEKTATANITTTFNENSFNVEVLVRDDILNKEDGLEILFGNRITDDGYSKTCIKYQMNVLKEETLSIYNGSSFVENNGEYTSIIKYIAREDKIIGYSLDLNIPYSLLDMTYENAKDNMAICPVIYNNNGDDTVKGISLDYKCDPDNQKTFIYVTDNDTYKISTYAYEGYQLITDKENEHWDLSQDYFPNNPNYANRVVKLTGSNEEDNHLIFHHTDSTTLYVEAEFLLTGVYAGESLGKFGFRIADKYGDGFIYFVDAHGGNLQSMHGKREAGYVLQSLGVYNWESHTVLPASYTPSNKEKVKLAIYRDGAIFKLYFNDYLVGELEDPSSIGQTNIYPEIFSFNLGIEVSNYLCTDDPSVYEALIPEEKEEGYMFKDVSSTMKNGIYWDLSNDTEQSSGVVSLNGHDGIDNYLFFNMSSNNYMYSRATFEVTDYLNKGDAWIKFGLTLFDGDNLSNSNQYMFYADAYTGDNNYASSLFHIVGNKFGRVLRQSGTYGAFASYDGSSSRFNLTTLKVTMELVYQNNTIYFYADGKLVGMENYIPKTNKLYMGVMNFGFGLDVTNYYCTTNSADSNISDYINEQSKALYYFLGSSVTYGSATNGVSFVDMMPKLLDCAVVKNAVSGTTLVDGNESYVSRLRQMPTNMQVEHLIVQLSTNDATQNKPLGTLSKEGTTDFDTTTIIGAIEDIILYAKNTWDCDVTFYTNPKYDNAKYKEMIDALYEVQEKWNIGIVDFYNYKDMEALDDATLKSYMADSIHPNSKGYEWMSGIFKDYLKEEYELNHPGDTI